MLRRLALTVVATAALSVHTTNARAQALESRIHSLRSESDDDAIGLSPYTMLYWFRALEDFGSGNYATLSPESDDNRSSMIPDVPDIGWARLLRHAASPSINSADDPSLPDNAQFFNPAILTSGRAVPSAKFDVWQFPPSKTSSNDSSDESSSPTEPVQFFIAPPSLPDEDAWGSSAAGSGEQKSIEDVDTPVNALALVVDVPSVAVIASPEPSTLWLFATGFAFLCVLSIKGKRVVA